MTAMLTTSAWTAVDIQAKYPGITLPAYFSIPPIVATRGPAVAELCRRVGFAPDVEQQFALDVIFAADPDTGLSLSFAIAIIVARQNMKSALFEMCCLGWLFITKERLIVWSAHEAATASESHRHLAGLIENSTMLSKRLPRTENKGIYTANGAQRIELRDGRRVIFKTRTKGAGRGLSGSKVILDEAYAVDNDQLTALLPTLSAQPDPQVLYGSSAGRPESAALRDLRDVGRIHWDGSLSWIEWCAGSAEDICDLKGMCDHRIGTEGCGMDKPAVIKSANPAYGVRITQRYIESERKRLDPAGFGRERLGWWDAPAEGVTIFDLEKWAAAAKIESQIVGPYALAVDVAADESSASLAVVGRNAEGKRHAEVIAHEPGTGWIIDAILAAVALEKPVAVALDESSPAGSLVADLLENGFVKSWRPDQKVPSSKTRLFLIHAREYAQACGGLVNDVRNDLIVHIDQPDLNRAVIDVRTRPLTDAYAWTRKDASVDISPLVAVTLARAAHSVFGNVKRKIMVAFS